MFCFESRTAAAGRGLKLSEKYPEKSTPEGGQAQNERVSPIGVVHAEAVRRPGAPVEQSRVLQSSQVINILAAVSDQMN